MPSLIVRRITSRPRRSLRLAIVGSSLLSLVWLASGCGGVEYLLRPRRSATIWAHSSGEYAATTLQVYTAARSALQLALSDPRWTACLEQGSDFADLPPAIIVDIDETALDNTAFNKMLDENQLEFSDELWDDWVHQAKATEVPGALAFLDFAAKRNVEIFYVTNRDHDLEDSTRTNLRKLGMPLNEEIDALLTRGEKSGWGTDKASRRHAVARTHRVLLIIGDALGDFTMVDGLTIRQRRALAIDYRRMWGIRWFVLPNPIYGGWARGIDPLPPSQDDESTSGG